MGNSSTGKSTAAALAVSIAGIHLKVTKHYSEVGTAPVMQLKDT